MHCEFSSPTHPNNAPTFSWRWCVWVLMGWTALTFAQGTCDSIKVGGARDWSPIAFIDHETNQPMGKGYQLARALGESLGVPVKLVHHLPWPRMIVQARQGQLDLVAGIVPNSERGRFLLFTPAFEVINLYAFVHSKNQLPITTIQDLIEYTRVDTRGTFKGYKVQSLLRQNMVTVEGERQIIAMILSKRADYFISSQNSVAHWLDTYPNSTEIVRLPRVIDSIDIVIGVSKASPCRQLMPMISKVVTRLYPREKVER